MEDNLSKGIKAYGNNSFDEAIEYLKKYITELKTQPYSVTYKENMAEAKDYLKRAEVKWKFIKDRLGE